ncbi:MAG: hypothetical protein ACKOWD_17625 [Rhodoferax sp.]
MSSQSNQELHDMKIAHADIEMKANGPIRNGRFELRDFAPHSRKEKSLLSFEQQALRI